MAFEIEYLNKCVRFRFSLEGHSLNMHNHVSMARCKLKSGNTGVCIDASYVDTLLTQLWCVKRDVEEAGKNIELPQGKIMRVLRECILHGSLHPPKATKIYNRLFPLF